MNPPPTPEFRSNQYEFNDEQNKVFSQLADAMGTVGTLTKLLGLAFVIFFGLLIYHAVETKSGVGGGLLAGSELALQIVELLPHVGNRLQRQRRRRTYARYAHDTLKSSSTGRAYRAPPS